MEIGGLVLFLAVACWLGYLAMSSPEPPRRAGWLERQPDRSRLPRWRGR